MIIEGRGARQCVCLRESIKRLALAQIPPLYQGLSLATVRPDTDRHALQGDLFDALRTAPEASYLLFGRNGCGKTLAGWLLYRSAIEAGRSATALSCSDLVLQFRAWEFDPDKIPAVQPDDLKTGERRLLFLDEIDKARPTEFAGETLFRLLDAAYTHRQQVVVTSNTPLNDLAAHWSRNNVSIGPSLVRRLMEMDAALLVEMF